MKAIKLIFILSSVILISCNNQPETTHHHIEDFTITLPSYMSEVKDRNADVIAEFEVDSSKNNKLELDLAIYKDNFAYKGNEKVSLNKYYKFVADDILGNNLESGSLNSAEDYNINGNKAMIFEISGKFNDNGIIEDYFFISGVIETSEFFYEVTAWTPSKFEKELKSKMMDIILSFKAN